MATRITTIEDALLLKNSSLRDGWGDWFNKKNVFLRKDRMFRSTFDLLNPLNNPLLQDPDAVSTTRLTKGDHTVQKWWIHEFRKVPSLVTKNRHKLNIKMSDSLYFRRITQSANHIPIFFDLEHYYYKSFFFTSLYPVFSDLQFFLIFNFTIKQIKIGTIVLPTL
ncbi:hypothetical protein VIGAN_08223300 [Vigna angularis var. angularis]|uniref:Uncharacterized protein n=1 Tax=Vigna angularis var. angularis TaxID=157739 RepID=A0A0S3SRN9_PHAAN|nr:hypothetical protein VIGAN_08223300 [Vigna angularis var. angularis]